MFDNIIKVIYSNPISIILFWLLTSVGLYIITTYAFTKLLIPVLTKLKFGQVVRDDGPETHLKKQGTPTMGGIVFIINFIIFMIIKFITYKSNYGGDFLYRFGLIIISFGLIGLYDDLTKILKKDSHGIKAKVKFVLQILFALIGIYLYMTYDIKFSHMFNYNYLYIPVLVFIIVGTNNAVNFTDGLDGLLTSVTIVITIFYIILSFATGLAEVKASNVVLDINLMFLGMEIGFLLLNKYPAKIFMGDTGSLFFGAYVVFMAMYFHIELLLPIYGFVYFMEALSVIIQVGYFKYSHGKRIFKMAPIHHHFEKCGMSEKQVVRMFTIITIICVIITIIILYFIIMNMLNNLYK